MLMWVNLVSVYGVPYTMSDKQAKTLPWAVQYFQCDAEHNEICKNHDDYCAKCWVNRDDGIKPEAEQRTDYGGQVSWHPGWRSHQLTGRVLAFSLLEALQLAIQQFSDGTMGKICFVMFHILSISGNILLV